jgi:2-(3-amino-3-carboxypropyl)histidine synthase
MFDFRLTEVAAFVECRRAKLVALQFPEGLKVHAQPVIEELERITGCRCIVIADPCYGACDISTSYHEFADVLVHFGHSEMPSLAGDENVLFVEVFADYEVLDLLPMVVDRLVERVGLVTTAQHVDRLPSIKSALEAMGKEVQIGHGDRRIKHAGQVLGCNVTAATSIADHVDCFLYIGSGNFHPLAIALDTGKSVLVLDPMMREVREMGELRDKILRQRHGAITVAQEAKSFGILVSTKPGQVRMELAKRIQEELLQTGRSAVILVANNIDPERLIGYQVDAFVSTACPRLAIDDFLRYRKPLLTPPELEIVLGQRKWEDYRFDSILA